MHPVETYLKSLAETHSTGGATAETSHYAALGALLDEVGARLKPRVRAVSQLASTGAGHPDFGDQWPIDGAVNHDKYLSSQSSPQQYG